MQNLGVEWDDASEEADEPEDEEDARGDVALDALQLD